MKINAKKTVQIDVTTMAIYTKVCDNFSFDLVDAQGEKVAGQEDGYVPKIMPGDHAGDYVILEIDLDTGAIKNWKKPTAKQLEELIVKLNGGEEE